MSLYIINCNWSARKVIGHTDSYVIADLTSFFEHSVSLIQCRVTNVYYQTELYRCISFPAPCMCIHYLLFFPYAQDAPLPLLVILHVQRYVTFMHLWRLFFNSLWETTEQELCSEVLYSFSTMALFSDAVTWWYFHNIDHVLWQHKTTNEIT